MSPGMVASWSRISRVKHLQEYVVFAMASGSFGAKCACVVAGLLVSPLLLWAEWHVGRLVFDRLRPRQSPEPRNHED